MFCLLCRYHLDGAKKGHLEPFSENLPGLPDNIRKSSLGGYWVGTAAVRKPAFSFVDFGAPRPWIKKFITKVRPYSQTIPRKFVILAKIFENQK